MSKLVRDKIPEIVMDSGLTVQVRKVKDDNEYLAFLIAKLDEEVQELKDALFAYDEVNTDDVLEELADILEVLYALTRSLGHGPETLRSVNCKKHVERGGFYNRYIMEDLDETNNLDDRDETNI